MVIKKFILLFSVLIYTSKTFCQFESNLNKVLAGKDFLEFSVYLENLKNTERPVNWNWEYLRDITGDYQEGVLFIEKFITDKENQNTGTFYTYKVSIITTNKKIAFYKLEKESMLSELNIKALKYSTIAELQDEIAFTKFENAFFEIFHVDLNEQDLFNTEIVYGEVCGLVGIYPEERIQMEEFVLNKDKKSLLNWLCSANTETQIYALDGLNQLKINGVTLTEQELKMINFVLTKKGTFHVCSGCFYSTPEINRITKRFNFEL